MAKRKATQDLEDSLLDTIGKMGRAFGKLSYGAQKGAMGVVLGGGFSGTSDPHAWEEIGKAINKYQGTSGRGSFVSNQNTEFLQTRISQQQEEAARFGAEGLQLAQQQLILQRQRIDLDRQAMRNQNTAQYGRLGGRVASWYGENRETIDSAGRTGYRVAQGALGYGAAALSQNPYASGTFLHQVKMFGMDISGTKDFTEKVVTLTDWMHKLRNAYGDLSDKQKAYLNNTVVASGGAGALAMAASYLLPKLGTAASFIGNRAADVMGSPLGPMAALGIGRQPMGAGWMLGGGLGLAGAGYMVNQAFGENAVGDAMQVGGGAWAGAGAGRMAGAALGRFLPRFAGAARFGGPIGFAAGTLASAYATFSPAAYRPGADAEFFQRYGGDAARGRELERSIAGSSGRAGDIASRASDYGFTPEQTRGAFGRAGVETSRWSPSAWRRELLGTNQEEAEKISQELIRPGSSNPNSAEGMRSRRDQLALSLNFQSRQGDVADLHGMLQQQAVMDPAQKEVQERLITQLQELVKAIEKKERENAGPGGGVAAGAGGAAGLDVSGAIGTLWSGVMAGLGWGRPS